MKAAVNASQCVSRLEKFLPNVDKLVKNQKAPVIVIPVKKGIQSHPAALGDSRFRGSDGLGDSLHGRQGYRGKEDSSYYPLFRSTSIVGNSNFPK